MAKLKFKPMSSTIPPTAGPRAEFKKIAVFCGSSIGRNSAYTAPTVALGEEMARRNIGLVYGGGNVGLMGVIAETVYKGHGCEDSAVVGVIPDYLEDREVSGTTVGETIVVKVRGGCRRRRRLCSSRGSHGGWPRMGSSAISRPSLALTITIQDMHTRKAKMFEVADAFIAIPGGLGTLDETIEISTWQQLGLHTKPVGLLNVNGFFDKLIEFLDHAVDEEFIRPASRGIILADEDPAALIDKLAAYVAPRSVVDLARDGLLDPNVRG